jgi:hypothetical protein
LQHGMDGSGFWVLGAVDQSADSCVGDGPGAHGTGFHRYVEIAIQQTVVSDNMARFSQGLNFGVRRWIVTGDRAIASASHDLAVPHDDGAYRNFAKRVGALRFAESLLHQ